MANVVEIDAATGQATERDFTADELAQRAIDDVAHAQAQAIREAAEAARVSARAKIAEASGLTPDEMAALGI